MCDLISQRPGVCLGLLGLSTFDAQAELQQSYSQTPVLCRMVWVLDRRETKIEPGTVHDIETVPIVVRGKSCVDDLEQVESAALCCFELSLGLGKLLHHTYYVW